jgi:threonine/homoserine/homoserine lactone efflux protein
VALNTFVDILAVLAAHRLVTSSAGSAARAKVLARASGVTMLGLGAYLMFARHEA